MTDLQKLPLYPKTDFYLKFPNAEMAMLEMKTAGFTQPSIAMNKETQDFIYLDDIITSNERGSVHVVGTIYTVSGNYMNIVTTPLEGYHVNIRTPDGQLPENLTPYIITPKTPRNVWA